MYSSMHFIEEHSKVGDPNPNPNTSSARSSFNIHIHMPTFEL